MNYWMFVVNTQEIFDQRMEDEFWGLGEKIRYRKQLKEGDHVVFYIRTPIQAFVGTASLTSPFLKLNQVEKEKYGHNSPVFAMDYGVRLDQIDVWDEPVSVDELIPQLQFIKDQSNWGLYFQGSINKLAEEDFQTIIGPTVRDALIIDVWSPVDSDFLEDISEDIRTSRNPETVEHVVRSFRRDQRVVNELKTLYEGCCQFKGCTNTIETETGWFTEAHHLIALGKGGSDDPTNLANLCPQHHKQLHHAKNRKELANAQNFWYKEEHMRLFRE